MVTDARLLSINIMVYAIFNERTVNLYAHSTDFKKFGMKISCAYQHYWELIKSRTIYLKVLLKTVFFFNGFETN